MATTTYLMAREAAVVSAREAIKDLSEALRLERYCEDGSVYAEHRDVWETTLAHLVTLQLDLARLVAALRPEFQPQKK